MLPDRQFDLFAAGGVPAIPPAAVRTPRAAVSEMDDPALIAAIPGASVATYRDLVDEAVKRGLAEAIPALETLCRRFKGFGLSHPVPEQVAALRAVGAIGGREAAPAIGRIIADRVVEGPGVAAAMREAGRLRCRLPDAVVLEFLRHTEPEIRASAACCAHRQTAAIVAMLTDLLEDLHPVVAGAAACALGRMGRVEARPVLLRILGSQPSAETIQAVSLIADDACIVLLGRIARSRPDMAEDALEALRDIDDERAVAIIAAIERGRA